MPCKRCSDKPSYEHMKCALCKEDTSLALKEKYAEYTLYECPLCAGQFWSPMKNPGATWYERDERYAGRNKDPLLDPTAPHVDTIRFLAPLTGAVLDVGCGTGNFLHYAREKGWRVRGIDFDADAIRTGETVFKLTGLEVADLPTFRRLHPEERFDLVTFFDVLEHVDNHHEFIGDVRALLGPRGYIAMTMPYGPHAKWLNPKDLPPRHLTRWSRTSLRNFLEREGFEIVRMVRKTEGIGFIILKLRFRYGRFFAFGMVDRVKSAVRKEGSIEVKSSAERTISWAKRLATLKDTIIFGIPALLIWLVMLPSRKRYVTLFCIARRKE